MFEDQELLEHGFALIRMSKYESATIFLSRCVAANQSNVSGWYWLGYALVEMGEKDDAKESFRRALRLSAASMGETFLELAGEYFDRGYFQETYMVSDLLTEFYPDDLDVNMFLAGLYMHFKRRREALIQWQKIVGLIPTQTPTAIWGSCIRISEFWIKPPLRFTRLCS